jgi:hypothetical protein
MKKAKLEMRAATGATRTEVTTDSGAKVPYDFLVICTGTAHDGQKSKEDRLLEYKKGIYSLCSYDLQS